MVKSLHWHWVSGLRCHPVPKAFIGQRRFFRVLDWLVLRRAMYFYILDVVRSLAKLPLLEGKVDLYSITRCVCCQSSG